MQLSVRSILVALVVVPCLSVASVAEDKFPWQTNMRKFVKLSPDQKQIYLDSFFESMFFILYGITDANNPEALKEVNGWIDCVMSP